MTAVKGPDIRNESRVRVSDLFDCFITPAGWLQDLGLELPYAPA